MKKFIKLKMDKGSNTNNISNDKNNIEYQPILVDTDDISQIKSLGYSFWGNEGIYSPTFYLELLKQNLSYVYKEKRLIIAVCLVRYEERENIVGIDLLCVKKEYQGKGLGKSLLNFCINNCVEKGCYKFYLHVATTNTVAIKLYQKLGFYKKKFIKNYYYNDPPPNNDAFLMQLNKTPIKKEIKSNIIKPEIKVETKKNEEIKNNDDNSYKRNGRFHQEYNKNNHVFYESNQQRIYNNQLFNNYNYNYSGYTNSYWNRMNHHFAQ